MSFFLATGRARFGLPLGRALGRLVARIAASSRSARRNFSSPRKCPITYRSIYSRADPITLHLQRVRHQGPVVIAKKRASCSSGMLVTRIVFNCATPPFCQMRSRNARETERCDMRPALRVPMNALVAR